MKLNKRKILIISLILLIITIISITCIKIFYKPTLEIPNSIKEKQNTYSAHIDWNNTENIKYKNNNKYNISKNIKKKHKYKTYNFTNMNLYTENDKCIIEFEITNLDNNIGDEKIIFINFLNKEKKIIHVEEHKISNINKNKTKKEKIIIPIDVSNAFDYEIKGL